MISFLFFACGGEPSYVRSRQEHRASSKDIMARERSSNKLPARSSSLGSFSSRP